MILRSLYDQFDEYKNKNIVFKKKKYCLQKKKKEQVGYFLREYQLHYCTIPIDILR